MTKKHTPSSSRRKTLKQLLQLLENGKSTKISIFFLFVALLSFCVLCVESFTFRQCSSLPCTLSPPKWLSLHFALYIKKNKKHPNSKLISILMMQKDVIKCFWCFVSSTAEASEFWRSWVDKTEEERENCNVCSRVVDDFAFFSPWMLLLQPYTLLCFAVLCYCTIYTQHIEEAWRWSSSGSIWSSS